MMNMLFERTFPIPSCGEKRSFQHRKEFKNARTHPECNSLKGRWHQGQAPNTPMQYTCRSSRDYYKQYLKGAFINHSDENLPERIEQLFQGARKDADYLLAKVWTPTKHVMSYTMLRQDLRTLFDGLLLLWIFAPVLDPPH